MEKEFLEYAAKVVAKQCGHSLADATAAVGKMAADKVQALVEHGRNGLLADVHGVLKAHGLQPLQPVADKAIEVAAEAVEKVAETAVETVVEKVTEAVSPPVAAPVAPPVAAPVAPAAAAVVEDEAK